MIPAIKVAQYIINYGNEKNYSISNLRLQKLLYFIQAYYLAFTPSHEPCFREEIEAWDFGPVVPFVYLTFRRFGGNSIPTIANYYWDQSDKDKEIIENIVDKLSVYSTVELMKITHKQTPWKESYKLRYNTIITKESIQHYFTKKNILT